MKAYILSIAGAVLLSAVITIISPSGKMGKFIKGTSKLLILVIMLAPVISIFSGKAISLESSAVGTDTGYLESCAKILEERDEESIRVYLSEEFCVQGDAQVTRSFESGFPIQTIHVKINDFGIIGQDEHIDIMRRVQAALEEKYGCSAVVS